MKANLEIQSALKQNTEEAELSEEIEAGLQLLSVKAELLKYIVNER
jgi:hypothetical protein